MITRPTRTLIAVTAGAAMLATAGSAAATPAHPAAGEPTGTECAELDDLDALADLPAGEALGASASFSIVAGALAEAGLVEVIDCDGPFTVFAPTDAAFEAIAPNVLESVLADDALLAELVEFHVIEGEAIGVDDLADADGVETLGGHPLPIAVDDDAITLNESVSVTCAGIAVANGVVHAIDGILQPPTDPVDGTGTSGPGTSGPGTSVPGTSIPG